MAERGLPVRLDDVRFSYGEEAMRFDVTFQAGKRTAIMGPSGSGKSTLLNLVAGFERPAAGRVFVGEIDCSALPPAARPVSMVFQENNLFGHLDLVANVGLGISPGLKLTSADRDRIAGVLKRTGLAGKEKRLPRELSGGERQRAALARAMLRDRPVLLMDEPFAALGPALRADMIDLLLAVQGEHGMTVLFVTHQPDDARRVGEHLVFIEDGRITASGPSDEILALETGSVRDYLGNVASHARSQEIARKPT